LSARRIGDAGSDNEVLALAADIGNENNLTTDELTPILANDRFSVAPPKKRTGIVSLK
jgi:hypothetical protein